MSAAEPCRAERVIELSTLGEQLSALRLCEATALESMRRSLDQHGQLSALTLFAQRGRLEIIDGFKRVRAARVLGWQSLVARIDVVGSVEAKLRLRALHEGHGLTELEEGWLVRSLYREERMSLPEIARSMSRHRSWVWRRLMLVESLDPLVQTDVRLGLVAPRAAVALSRLPRGNQPAGSAVVVRRGLTVRQTELLVEEVLGQAEGIARATLLARRLDEGMACNVPGPRATRMQRSEADWMGADILRIREVAARLEARLLSGRLASFTPTAAELLHDALVQLSPVLRALDSVIGTVTRREDFA